MVCCERKQDVGLTPVQLGCKKQRRKVKRYVSEIHLRWVMLARVPYNPPKLHPSSLPVSDAKPRPSPSSPPLPPFSLVQEFLDAFKPFAGSLEPPKFPSDYLTKKEPAPEGSGIPEKLTFSFFVPHETILKDEKVDLVLLPAVTGDFGAMPGHVPTLAQLRPGVVSIHTEQDKDVKKYFVSGGFAMVHADSTADICAVEAIPIEDLDGEAVRAGLAEYQAKLGVASGKGDDYEAAAAQIGVEVYSAMSSALGH